MTPESLAADIVDRIQSAPIESKLNLATMVARLIRDGLPVVHPALKQCCGCHAIWQIENLDVGNTCKSCGGECGGLRIAL